MLEPTVALSVGNAFSEWFDMLVRERVRRRHGRKIDLFLVNTLTDTELDATLRFARRVVRQGLLWRGK